jgi:hypothetical protein
MSNQSHLSDDGTVNRAHDRAIIQRLRAWIGLLGGSDALSGDAHQRTSDTNRRQQLSRACTIISGPTTDVTTPASAMFSSGASGGITHGACEWPPRKGQLQGRETRRATYSHLDDRLNIRRRHVVVIVIAV